KNSCVSSPVSGLSLQSDGSSSSLLSAGVPDIGSTSPPMYEDQKSHFVRGDGFSGLDNKEKQSNPFDDFELSADFDKMYIS
ncbi:hypothetical protein M569_11352, partial [Genlisea aurea]